MRLCYLALDRLDLQFPSNEVARWMQAPTVGDMEALKRVAFTRHGRQEFVRQVEEPSHVVVSPFQIMQVACANTQTYFIIQTVQVPIWHVLLAPRKRFYALVKGRNISVSTLKDLGVDISKNTKFDHMQCWKCELTHLLEEG